MQTIADIEWHIEYAEHRMQIGQSLETASPKLHRRTFVNSANDLKHGMNWIWLQTQRATPFGKISEVLADIAKRSLPFYGVVANELFRDKNDYYLMSAAILTGNQEVITKVTETIREVDVAAETPNYFRSLAGILKFMIEGDLKRAGQQFEIHCSCKGKLTGLNVAKKTFLRAFMAGDIKALQRQLNGTAETYWGRLERSKKPTVQTRDGEITLGMVWDTNNFWPWPEAVILRLMTQRGIEFKTDEFWLPKSLIAGKD